MRGQETIASPHAWPPPKKERTVTENRAVLNNDISHTSRTASRSITAGPTMKGSTKCDLPKQTPQAGRQGASDGTTELSIRPASFARRGLRGKRGAANWRDEHENVSTLCLSPSAKCRSSTSADEL